jgi:hypothetical protein
MPKILSIVTLGLLLASTAGLGAQEREIKVRKDRQDVVEDGFWIYNDLPKGFAEAKQSGKPLLVVIRCIPCEACAKLDAQVVNRHPVVQKLLSEFVCVRIVQANGLDLSLFQYDYDQSFAAFFLNADKTIYGRYGTRSHQTESDRDVSVEGFARALEGALALHKQSPANAAALAAKRGPDAAIKVPEEFPSLKDRYGPRLNYEGNVVKSCIHCHQVGEAFRLFYRSKNEPIPDSILYPYPLPNLLGLTLDPDEKARVLEVAAGSSAAKDGFQAGDEIVSLEGQPLLSIADVQWVLHHAANSGRLQAEVRRGERKLLLPVTLEPSWRRRGDISWRATSWDLRRMTTGGLLLESLSADDRRAAGLADDVLALRVKHVGQYGEHAAAKHAGFQKGDILVELNGKTAPLTESEWMTLLINTQRPGDRVSVTVLRDAKRVTLALPIQ